MWSTSQAFKNRMADPVIEVRAKCEILDTDFNVVRVVGGGGPDKAIIDGTVDLDTARGTRRTLTMAFLNENGEFSPTSDWGGLLYVNRIIRLYRGLVVGEAGNDEVEYIPIGTFMIDKTETLVERGMSTVIISGSDMWKKFNKSQYVRPITYPKGMLLNTFFGRLATEAGVTRRVLGSLDSRTSASDRLQTAVSFEKGETRGDALKTIAGNYGIDVYFDPLGRFVTEDTRTNSSRAVVWEFGETTNYPQLAYFIRNITDDDRLYNHVFVTGTGREDVVYTAELRNTDPASPTNINRIGDRVYRMESGVLASQESVNLAARSLFQSTRILTEQVAMEVICHPAFEGNDIVRVIENQYSEIATNFSINTLNVPLLTSKQKITMGRVINLAV